MSHLSIDRLAALADERPTADEAAHVAGCARCAHEIEAHRSLLDMARGERTAMSMPLTRWESLAPALRSDGLISDAPTVRKRSRVSERGLLQVAAALLLVAGGAFLGRASVTVTPAPDAVQRVADSPDTLVATFASVEEALRLRQVYRENYQRAVAYLAQQDSGRVVGTPATMKARLAALDRVAGITREALNDAPFDPILNDFFLNSHTQREATLRELNTVLPKNVQLNSF